MQRAPHGALFFVWPEGEASLRPVFRFIRIRSPYARDQRRTSTCTQDMSDKPLRDLVAHFPTFACRRRRPVPPSARAPLRAVLLDAVPRRDERQHLQGRLHVARHVPGRALFRRRSEDGRVSDFRDLHRAVRAVLGHLRTDRRQVRQGRARAPREELRDRRDADRRRGLPAAQRAASLCVHFSDGRAFHRVRAGEVRVSAAASRFARARRRQRARRDGHVRRDPDRHDHRRRGGGRDGAWRDAARRRVHRVRDHRARRVGVRAEVGRVAAGSAHQLESVLARRGATSSSRNPIAPCF